MDRHKWMYDISRLSDQYSIGVEEFISCALENQKKQRERRVRDMIPCPCSRCFNLKMCASIEALRYHLFCYGFRHSYTNWFWHGEELHSKRTSGKKYESGGDGIANKAGKSQKLIKHQLSPEKGGYAAKRGKRVVDEPIASLSISESSVSSTASDARTGCGYNRARKQGKDKEGGHYNPMAYTGKVSGKVGALQEKVCEGSRTPHGHHESIQSSGQSCSASPRGDASDYSSE